MCDHNVAKEATENVGNKVDSSQLQSDSLSFGEGNEGDDALPANKLVHVQQDPIPSRVHFESMDASLESNHHMEIEMFNVVQAATT